MQVLSKKKLERPQGEMKERFVSGDGRQKLDRRSVAQGGIGVDHGKHPRHGYH
jgi:hypothetical protein